MQQESAGPGQPPEYHVFDRRWAPRAVGRYVAKEALKRLMASVGLRPWTAAALRVVDTHDRELFTVVFPGFRARSLMLIRNSGGEDLGHVVKTGGYLRVRYDLRSGGSRVGSLQLVNRRQSEATVVDRTGTEAAAIRTIDAAAPFDVARGASGYYLEAAQPMEEPLQTLVVASTVALQAATGGESDVGETQVLRLAMIPRRLDPLRRRISR